MRARNAIWWTRCYRCGEGIPSNVVYRREALTGVQVMHTWWGFPLCRTKLYQIVDLCPDCDEEETSHQHQQRRVIGAAIGGVGVVLFGWNYLGAVLAVGVGVISFFAVLRVRRGRKQLVILPPERNTI